METRNLDHAFRILYCGFGNSQSAHSAIDTVVSVWQEQLGATHGKLERESESVRFHSDISSIHLRGMGIVPVLLLGNDNAAMRKSVSQFISDTAPANQLPIVACTTDSGFQHMRWRAGLRVGQYVVLSRTDLRSILLSSEPTKQLRRQILHQIPFRKLVPFTPANPTEGAMFFGRQTELGMLVEQDDVDYALCGRGGIGKTSLLRQMQWILSKSHDPRTHRVVEVDLLACHPNADAAAQEIAQRVSHTRFSHDLCVGDLHAFFRHTHAIDKRFSDGPIDLIIDEADSVLAYDQQLCLGMTDPRDGYPLLRALRHAKNQDLIRVTICGRSHTRKILADRHNPFYGRMKLIEISALETENARRLLYGPLEHLGVSVDRLDPNLNRLLAVCEGIPLKIHHLGLAIADMVSERSSRNLHEQDVVGLKDLVPA